MSNLRVAIMLGIPLAPMNLKQNPSQLSPDSVPHKGVSIGEGRVWGHHCLGPKLPKAKTDKAKSPRPKLCKKHQKNKKKNKPTALELQTLELQTSELQTLEVR